MLDPVQALTAVRERIAAAAARSGRPAAAVELLAISKTHGPDAIRAVADAGQTLFGESRVQEARAKTALLPSRLHWHFIGHLQKNKVRQALPLFELFHGVDSLEIARQFQRIAGEDGLRPRILLEINVAGESTKFGFSPSALPFDLDDLLALDRLEISGLMAMAPYHPEPENSRRFFVRLRELRDDLQKRAGVSLPELSIGMSGDYEVAIEEGATIVRVGSAIFGARSGKQWTPPPEAGSV